MSVQTSYGYSTPKGIPGGLYDQSPYIVDTRLNEAANGKLLFGMGVVQGSTPGANVALPTSTSTVKKFEGITVNGFTQSHDLEGKIALNKGQSVGLMKQGRVWARLVDDITPAYGDDVYLVISGDDAGLFTISSDSASTKIAVNGKFIGAAAGGVAPVEMFSATVTVTAPAALSELSDVDLTTAATDGQVLKYNGTDSKWKAGSDATE